jgi:ubiquinone/menaquinone biosynthesis C-methylase UbiE
MSQKDASPQYALGNTEFEDERLAWQSERFDPLTDRFFRDAGVSTGQRVLELGSGAGHVAMLTSRIVGPTGEVVGVEQDAGSIARARVRVADCGLSNVTFTQSDVNRIPRGDQFDAALGRFILMFLPDPVRVVRSLAQLVRPGGRIAFQEVSWARFLERCANWPLCFACASLIHDTFRLTGANTEMGPALTPVYREAGLPAPTVSTHMLLGNAGDLTRWIVDLLRVLRPQYQQLDRPLEKIGDMETVRERLMAELSAVDGTVGGPDLVGTWAISRS